MKERSISWGTGVGAEGQKEALTAEVQLCLDYIWGGRIGIRQDYLF